MPTYDYRCKACNYEFEKIQRMTDDPLTECPDCGGEVKRLIGTGAGIIFKGSGFYETDYRSETYKKDAAKETKSPSSSTDTTAASSSSKSEAKSSTTTDTASS